MVEINLYIIRIGTFSQKSSGKKPKFMKMFGSHWSKHEKPGKLLLSGIQSLLKLLVILTLLGPSCWYVSCASFENPSLSSAMPCSGAMIATQYPKLGLGGKSWSGILHLEEQFQTRGRKETSNFLAKYVNGNRTKGIFNLHLNIRSLNNKVSEVKRLIKEHSPNIFGLSECELRKINNYYDESRLKIPGYKILFPKSWAVQGYARVIVYVKNNFEHEQLHDLEDEQVQSVWLRGGFKMERKFIFAMVIESTQAAWVTPLVHRDQTWNFSLHSGMQLLSTAILLSLMKHTSAVI